MIWGQSKVRVHIDRKQYESPNPTTGLALYELGHIHHGFELFREVEGSEEDKAIPNDGNEIHLKEDEHFYSTKEFQDHRETLVPKRLLQENYRLPRLSLWHLVVPPTGEKHPFLQFTYEKR